MDEGTKLARVMAHYGFVLDNAESKVKIVCPFHEDINPSMIVDFETGSYFCFGCQESGREAVDFVAKIDKIDKLIAYKKLTKIINNPKLQDIKQRKYAERKSDKELLLKAHDYYACLNRTNWELDATPGIVNVGQYMVNRGITKQTLINARAKYTYNRSYPIVFPILDNGRFKGYVQRTTTKKIEEKRKYLYNQGFSRATTISGTYDKESIPIIVEGTIDMLKIKQFGVRNVGAILGWKITREQIQKIKEQGITTVISALDNDECGHKGTEYLRNFFDVINWKYLKGIKDPGDFDQVSFTKMYNKTMQQLINRRA